MYVVSMLPVLCRRPLSCTYVCVGVHKCVMRMHRAFHVSPWRHVSGVDPSLYSDSSGEREATAELQTVRRESQPFSHMQVRSNARCYSLKMHISRKPFSVRVCKRPYLVTRGWVHSTVWCWAFLWSFIWVLFQSLEWHRKNFEQILLQTPGVTP